jgi:hypothetical protein
VRERSCIIRDEIREGVDLLLLTSEKRTTIRTAKMDRYAVIPSWGVDDSGRRNMQPLRMHA